MNVRTSLWLSAAVVVACAALLPAADATASEQATQLRAAVPRYGGAKEFDPEDEDYQMMIATLVAIPVALALLTFLVAFLFCCCRCCSMIGLCHCCVRPPREEGYSKRARFVPWLFLALFGALVFAMATYGMTENDKLSDTLVAEESSGKSSFANFLPRVFEGLRDKIEDLREPIIELLDELQPTVDEALVVINRSVGTISNGTEPLVDELNAFNSTWAGYSIVTPLATYSCDFCSTVGNTMADLATQIEEQTGDMVTDMRQTVNDVTDTLTSEVENIAEKIGEINDTMDDGLSSVNDADDSSKSAIETLQDIDPLRNQVTMIIYIVPLAGLAMVILGTLFKIGCLFKINVWVYFLATFVFWLLLAVYLPVAVVIGDACVYADQEEAKLSTKTDDFSKVAHSCLVNTSVLDALNATDQLDFAEMIEFPEMPNVTEAFDFEALAELQAEVNALNVSTFGWDDSAITAPVDSHNSAYGQSRAYAGFEDLDPDVEYPAASTEKDDFETAQQSVRDAKTSKASLESALAEMRNDTASLVETSEAMEADFTVAVADIEELEELIDPFIAIANRLIGRARCAFLGDLYRELNTLTCTNIVNHFAVLAMTCFFIAFSGWWIITMSQISASRVPRPYKGDDWDDDAAKKGSEVEMRQIKVKSTHAKH